MVVIPTIKYSHRRLNFFRVVLQLLQVVYYIHSLYFEPAGLFAAVLAGYNTVLQKPFCFPLADMANAVELVESDRARVIFYNFVISGIHVQFS